MKSLSRERNDFHFWRSILIALVLIVLPFSCNSYAQLWEPFTPGGAGWEVLSSGSSSTYRFNALERLSYDASNGQWSQKGQPDGGTWSNLGNAGQSSTFIGDGTSHSIGSGWTYIYNGSNACNQDSSWLAYNGSYRLAYNYTEGQWWQKGTDWSKLGSSGISSTFIGDGTSHSIGSGWTYMYNGSNARNQDSSWLAYNGSYRLAYNYTEGQWWHKGTDWSKLGSSGQSSTFIGDGTSHSIGSGWTYMYNGSNARNQDSSWLAYDGSYRLAYNYTEGQWWHKGTDWSKLGNTGLSSSFIGDGGSHDLKDGWIYTYELPNDRGQSLGYWRNTALNLDQFSYDYVIGEWFDKGNGDGWEPRGYSGLSSLFIGDGNTHMMDGRWSYSLVSGVGHWTDTLDLLEYKYDYSSGEWDWLNPDSQAWEDYNKTFMKSAYADLTGDQISTLVPKEGVQPLDVLTLGFAALDKNYINPDYQKSMQYLINSSVEFHTNPDIFWSIGGAHSGPEKIAEAGGAEKVVANVLAQKDMYNAELKNGKIVGVDIDLENNVDADTINKLAKGFHEAGLKVSIAPQVITKGWPEPQEINPANPTNLVLTSGGHENQYGLAIQNGYVDVIKVQAYNTGGFTCNNYYENQVPFIKNVARALNNWANDIFPVPEGTQIFVGTVANQIGGGQYTIFNPNAAWPIPVAYDDQKILNELKADVLTMQDDPINYGRISGIFDWSLNADYNPKRWGDTWAVPGGFNVTIFGATPVPDPYPQSY